MQREPRVCPAAAATLLEGVPDGSERPSLVDAWAVEDATMRAHAVPRPFREGFAAFLDGTQESRVVARDRAAPIVEGRVAAAVRVRVNRRLVTWREPVVELRLYVPFAYTPRRPWAETFPASALVDTTGQTDGDAIPPPHPTLLLERASQAVSRHRDEAERRLAERWCEEESRPLFIDGGIGGSEIVARASCAVGVIKSHRTFYGGGNALDVVLSLRAAERTSVMRIAPRDRCSVLSWYLRLRDPMGHDAFWGLVRVEVAETEHVTDRADEVSGWVLAEMAPNAMPDGRWDRMAYGVRNCEAFLRALT